MAGGWRRPCPGRGADGSKGVTWLPCSPQCRYDSARENYAKFLKIVGLDADEVLELDACVANGIGDGSAVTNTIFEITQQQPIRFMQFANDYSQAFKAI